MIDEDGGGGDGGYSWEAEYERTWEAIPSAEQLKEMQRGAGDGGAEGEQQRRRTARRRAEGDGTAVRRGIHRSLVLVVDMGRAMAEKDDAMRPSRLGVALSAADAFIREFFDQSPTSQLGTAVTRNSEAAVVAPLGANPARQIEALRAAAKRGCSGEISLQNALSLCADVLRGVPRHVSKEVVLVVAGLTTCDPGNVFETVRQLGTSGVRVSFVSLSAELRIFARIAEETGGTSRVALTEHHARELLLEHTRPPAAPASAPAQLVKMGFPQRVVLEEHPSFCSCHQELRHGGFLCPQCGAKSCDLPVTCAVCGLSLLSSTHLARSYHHLFPVPAFSDAPGATAGECGGCALDLATSTSGKSFRCPRCNATFCSDCEAFIHETLHNCPSCLLLPPPPPVQKR